MYLASSSFSLSAPLLCVCSCVQTFFLTRPRCVSAPRVEIVDERGGPMVDKFYKTGSTIELKCVISQVPHPSTYVTWKHGQRMLNYDTSRGGIRWVLASQKETIERESRPQLADITERRRNGDYWIFHRLLNLVGGQTFSQRFFLFNFFFCLKVKVEMHGQLREQIIAMEKLT